MVILDRAGPKQQKTKMQNQQNHQKGITKMRTFQILRDHLIKLADLAKPVHPYGDENLPSVTAIRVGKSMIKLLVGNAFDLLAVITQGESHKILFQYNDDGSEINVTLLSGKGMSKEVWNILYPTSIGSKKYVQTDTPVMVSKNYKTIGKIDGVTVINSDRKEIRGCDFIITYDKSFNDSYEERIQIDKIYGRSNCSKESLAAFAELMGRFVKKPTNAFAHILMNQNHSVRVATPPVVEAKILPALETEVAAMPAEVPAILEKSKPLKKTKASTKTISAKAKKPAVAKSTKKSAVTKPVKKPATLSPTKKKKLECVKLELPKFEATVRADQIHKSKNQIERELRSNPPINNSFAALQQLVQ